MVEHVNAIVDTTEYLLARTHSEDRHIRQAVYALSCVRWENAIYDETALRIVWVDEKIILVETAGVRPGKLD